MFANIVSQKRRILIRTTSLLTSAIAFNQYDFRLQRVYCNVESENNHYLSNADAISKAMEQRKDPYDVADEDEELEWDIKKDNCPFCRTFLDSPCRVSFQRWSKCVDQAKKNGEDYIGLCKSYTEVSLFHKLQLLRSVRVT